MRTAENMRDNFSLYAAVVIIFTAGVILGAAAFLNLPEALTEPIAKILSESLSEASPLRDIIISQFVTEAIWVFLIWLMAALSVMAPMVAAIVAVRGFTIGFSSAFITARMTEAKIKLLCTYIFPQCVFSLPLMTLFAVICIVSCVNRRQGEATDLGYFAKGILFLALTLMSSIFEGIISHWCMIL